MSKVKIGDRVKVVKVSRPAYWRDHAARIGQTGTVREFFFDAPKPLVSIAFDDGTGLHLGFKPDDLEVIPG